MDIVPVQKAPTPELPGKNVIDFLREETRRIRALRVIKDDKHEVALENLSTQNQPNNGQTYGELGYFGSCYCCQKGATNQNLKLNPQ